MSRKEMEIESTYSMTGEDENGFSPDEREEYERWLDEINDSEPTATEIETDSADLPF